MPRYRFRFYSRPQSPGTAVLFSENLDRPVDSQCNYLLGDIKVIQGDTYYSADLYSTHCLNEQRDWGKSYYERLWALLPFFTLSPDTEDDAILMLVVKDPQDDTKYLSAKCKKSFGKTRFQILAEFLQKYTEQQRRKVASLTLDKEAKTAAVTANLKDLQSTADDLDLKRRLLLIKLSTLYKEKIKKYKELQEDTKSEKSNH